MTNACADELRAGLGMDVDLGAKHPDNPLGCISC